MYSEESIPSDRQLPITPVWPSQDQLELDQQVDRQATIRARLGGIYQSLCHPDFINLIAGISGVREIVEHLRVTIESIDRELNEIPTISVALLGPSRHGKSTLLNALASCSILPMSDIKPCTASIVSLRRADEWGFEIRFITQKRLEQERRQAVADAREYLSRISKKQMDDQPDDPQYVYSTLQRFIQLFKIDVDLPVTEMVQTIDKAEIPQNIQRLLGQFARPRSSNVDEMKVVVEKYLSTKDIYWTIVDACEISGPFEDWHPNLKLVDVPGTNDTDPQRTAITNSLRKTAKAVAICTSDSNLGNDIQSWLRNSSVLGDFLEATEQSRQHLFILRTKFDAYHPEIDETQIDEEDEASEDRLLRVAIELHKEKQTESYREMFRNIAAPLLPLGRTPEESKKREEMLSRIDGIRVFFVSALAHEAFAGRLRAGVRQKRRLSEHFQDDPEATGIPSLKRFANELAETYLSEFYFSDLERRLEVEVDRLVRFFRQQWTTLSAEVSGGSKAIAELVQEIDTYIIPSLKESVEIGIASFNKHVKESADSIAKQLSKTESRIDERIAHVQTKWNGYYWNSLQAAARKNGVHTTYNGVFIDINQDVCGLLIDDIALSWATYRDTFIRSGVEVVANDIATNLQDKLDEAAAKTDVPEATSAIDAIVSNLSTIARSQRNELRRQVESWIQDMESIRSPAYESVKNLMIPIYVAVAAECGQGSRQRMIFKLCTGTNSNVRQMWLKVSGIVTGAIHGLEDKTSDSLRLYGQTAISELRKASGHLKEIGNVVHRDRLLRQLDDIRSAALLLWQSLTDAGKIVVVIERTVPLLNAPLTDRESNEATKLDMEYNRCADTRDGEADKALEAEIARPTKTEDDQDRELMQILQSPVFLVQKEQSGRSAPNDSLTLQVIATLRRNHGRMTLTALGERIAVPAFRLRGVLPAIQRILNLDGQHILVLDRVSDTVELNGQLLFQEFLDN